MHDPSLKYNFRCIQLLIYKIIVPFDQAFYVKNYKLLAYFEKYVL